MSVSEMALSQGMRDTRGALAKWGGNPRPVLTAWVLGGLGFGVALLTAVMIIASIVQPDLTFVLIPGVDSPVSIGDYLHILLRNSLVLALHAVACVAGFIAGSSLPLQAQHMTGLKKVVHERARPIAFAWVVLVICFSLTTQAYILGSSGRSWPRTSGSQRLFSC